MKLYDLIHKKSHPHQPAATLSASGCECANNHPAGFSLVELLIAMAVGLVVLGAMYSVFTIQNKTFANQEQIVEMQQNARAAMDMMSREIMMAGYDPSGLADAKIVSATSNSINFTLDITGNGDTSDSNENITYSLYTPADGIQKLGRKSTAGATNQPVAEHVQSLTFQYKCKSDGITPADVCQIKITITGRTAKPDPAYTDPTFGDHYRRYTLTSQVTPRNLAY